MIEAVAPPPASEIVRTQWRRWRGPAFLVAFILAGGLVVALIASGRPVAGALDPRDTGASGAHAIAALLENRGQTVTRVASAAGAAALARSPGATVVVANPEWLSPGALRALAGVRANLVLVAPGPATLSALAPQVRQAGVDPTRRTLPMCSLPAARLAGSAWMGGQSLRTNAPGAFRCYPSAGPGTASLVRYRDGGRVTTVLGTGAPLTNQGLGRDGNAALAMNLLGHARQVVWLVPAPPEPPAARPGGPLTAGSLVPSAFWLVTLELAVAVVLAAGWRMRRFGPLVAEPLPIVVRASETVRGHGRLYRARRARGRAAAVLRAAAVSRITARLGLPGGLAPADLAQELARRTGRDPAQIQAILLGPDPVDDAALVTLATDLDALEGQVLSQ